jgi:hypothetical protein
VEQVLAVGYMPDTDTCPVAAAYRFADTDPISVENQVAGNYRGQEVPGVPSVEMTNPKGHRIRRNISLRM